MATFSPVVSCCEEAGTASEQVGPSITNCSVVLRVPWANRFLLIADLLTNRRAWPYLSGWTNPPRANAAGISAWNNTGVTSGQSITYEDALVTVQYTNNPATDVVTEQLEPTVEFQTLDYKNFRWGSKAGRVLLEAEAPGRQLRGFNLVRTIHDVALPLNADLLDLGGTCNEDPYTSTLLGLTFDAETLLFNTPSINRVLKSDGSSKASLVLRFTHKREGWNKFWRPGTGQYEEIFSIESDSIYKNYPPADYSNYLY